MTPGMLAMCVVTFGLSALVASLLAGAGLPALDRAAKWLTPHAATRLWRAVALAPGLVAFAVLVAVLGLVGCHCIAHGAHHPHLCLQHPMMWPTRGLALLAGTIAVHWSLAVARGGWHAWRARNVRRHLESASAAGMESAHMTAAGTAAATVADPVRRVPGSIPWAVTAGFFRPQVFITDAMGGDADLRVVLEHERAHAAGRHDLWQWLMSLAAFLHLPGIGHAIARRVSIAHEMTADEAAGRAVGDRRRVAAALVRLARAASAAPAGGIGFGSSPLDMRVRSLLSDAPASSSSKMLAWGLAAATCVIAAIVLEAHRLHHALETLFGYVG